MALFLPRGSACHSWRLVLREWQRLLATFPNSPVFATSPVSRPRPELGLRFQRRLQSQRVLRSRSCFLLALGQRRLRRYGLLERIGRLRGLITNGVAEARQLRSIAQVSKQVEHESGGSGQPLVIDPIRVIAGAVVVLV